MPTFVFFDYNKDKIEAYSKILSGSHNDLVFLNCTLDEILVKYFGNPFILVSPANSYGDMSGGIDRDIVKKFPKCKQAVLDIIKTTGIKDRSGRNHIPVGSCRLIQLDIINNKPRALLIAPTMETPKNIVGTNNVLLTFATIYKSTKNLSNVTIVAIPCLGTGVGGMNGEESALQILKWFKEVNKSKNN